MGTFFGGPYILRGSIYYKQKKYGEAIEDYTKANNLNDSNQIPALMNRAMAYRAIEKFKEALADYDKVIALDTDAEDAYIERANINCNNTYDYSAAIYDATAAYKLNPKNGIALLFRAYAFKNLGNWKASEYDYTQAFALGTGTANSYVNRGEVYEKLGKINLAINDYRKALELDPKHANAQSALTSVLAKLPPAK